MGMTSKLELGPDPSALMGVDLRLGLVEAGHAILAISDAQAPREETPRHGVHMTDTGFVAATVSPDGEDVAAIGYGAFWAVWQHENMDWHHEHGHAKFLELAMAEGAEAAYEILAAAVRKGFKP